MFRELEVISVTGSHPFYQMQAALFYRIALPSYKLRHIVGVILWKAGSEPILAKISLISKGTHGPCIRY